MTTKNLGGWTVGSKEVTYAYAIKYIKTALDFIRKREAEEKANLDAVDSTITQDPDWPLRLSEWKLAKGCGKSRHIRQSGSPNITKSGEW